MVPLEVGSTVNVLGLRCTAGSGPNDTGACGVRVWHQRLAGFGCGLRSGADTGVRAAVPVLEVVRSLDGILCACCDMDLLTVELTSVADFAVGLAGSLVAAPVCSLQCARCCVLLRCGLVFELSIADLWAVRGGVPAEQWAGDRAASAGRERVPGR